jgi:hypothetical protein
MKRGLSSQFRAMTVILNCGESRCAFGGIGVKKFLVFLEGEEMNRPITLADKH